MIYLLARRASPRSIDKARPSALTGHPGAGKNISTSMSESPPAARIQKVTTPASVEIGAYPLKKRGFALNRTCGAGKELYFEMSELGGLARINE